MLFSYCMLLWLSCSYLLRPFFYRCAVAFPDDYKALVPKLLTETMAAIMMNFVARINLATGDVVPETKALAKGEILYYSSWFQKLV